MRTSYNAGRGQAHVIWGYITEPSKVFLIHNDHFLIEKKIMELRFYLPGLFKSNIWERLVLLWYEMICSLIRVKQMSIKQGVTFQFLSGRHWAYHQSTGWEMICSLPVCPGTLCHQDRPNPRSETRYTNTLHYRHSDMKGVSIPVPL